MAASEASLLEPTNTAPRAISKAHTRRTMILIGLLLFVVGIATMWLALVSLGGAEGLVKVPLFLVSLTSLFLSFDRIGKGIWGEWFDPGFWLSFVWLIGLATAALFAGFLPLAEHQDSVKTIAVPGNARPDLLSSHPLGTNNFSLDLLARCIYGARVSLLTVALAVSLSMIVGGTIGLFAGYFRGWLDAGIGVFTDAILSVPPLILLIALAAVLGTPDTVPDAVIKSGLALTIVGIPTMIRLSRANTLVFAQREFVLASRSLGARNVRIIFRELLPNVVLPILSYAFIIAAVLIVAEGSLAFLGLGLQQPKPSWGNMIAEGGLIELREHPHVPLAPGVFMFLTVFSLNRIGDRARALWDPRDAKV